jgi:tripartite-type tricarboxylate transporter receptor subunit TctC
MKPIAPILAGAAVLLVLIAGHASAQTPAEFYRDKQIKMIVGNPPGGDYDLGGRLLARYMGEHIPGKPSIVVQNMPGASTVIAANWLYNIAPRDGTVFGSFSRHLPGQSAIGRKNIQADPREFNWIGGTSLPSRVCAVSAKSPVKTATELFGREVIMAGSGAGTTPSILPTVLNKVIGTKFRIVEGYAGSNDALIALERGEVEGICHTYGLFRSSHASWVKEGKIRVLIYAEESEFPDDPNVPSVFSFAKTEREKQLLRFIFGSVEFGRPYVAPPGTPADRVDALRKAFMAAVKDPGLVAEAERGQIDMIYRSPELQMKLVHALYAMPKDLMKEAEALMPEGGLN